MKVKIKKRLCSRCCNKEQNRIVYSSPLETFEKVFDSIIRSTIYDTAEEKKSEI